MKGLSNKKIQFLTGIISFVYWILPVIQFASYESYTDKVNNHYIFFISAFVYQSIEMLEEAPIPILVQLVFFLLTWFVLYKLVVFIVKRRNKND